MKLGTHILQAQQLRLMCHTCHTQELRLYSNQIGDAGVTALANACAGGATRGSTHATRLDGRDGDVLDGCSDETSRARGAPRGGARLACSFVCRLCPQVEHHTCTYVHARLVGEEMRGFGTSPPSYRYARAVPSALEDSNPGGQGRQYGRHTHTHLLHVVCGSSRRLVERLVERTRRYSFTGQWRT